MRLMDFNYPKELPVSAQRERLLALMRSNRVVVVQGDTGSGKTTQLPKMALELDGDKDGTLIACTQPRRIAALTVAERVAHELASPVGGIVGYQHRFAKAVSDKTRIKFMTDGVLLAEVRNDPLLRRYSTIIVDEAHERTLNVDFLLGFLKRILSRRHDLRVVVSSATLDANRFSEFFGNAPVVSVSGRTYPIEIRWRDTSGEDMDLPREVGAAMRTLSPTDDTLVFLPGERDIRETADHLRRMPELRDDDIIPLIASLPDGEQRRAFNPSSKRRIILATNVAETSITIPRIRAVVDSGLARIPRYIHRTQVQRLQIERISQASARQRAGRCGRIGPGVCVRLYSEKDFLSRDEWTVPEILRSSLAGVILTMLDLRIGDLSAFPFIDPPKPAYFRQGLRELIELGAIHHDANHVIRLTKTGLTLAKMPIEPRLARMMISASRFACLPSAIPAIAAMSCDDPRRRPIDERDKADQAHAKFRVKKSDFLGTLKLWRWWKESSQVLSQTKLRQLAEKNYLSFSKMREWKNIVQQLTVLSERFGLDVTSNNGGDDALHRALLSGLLSRIGHFHYEDREYRGAHGLKFFLHPASVLSKEKKAIPEWIIAGEIVETTRMFARNAAVIDPAWIEQAAGNICKKSWCDPTWDETSGFVRATERVTLYGLVIVPARRCDLSTRDPKTAREIFIRHAFILGEYPHPPKPVRHNLDIVAQLDRRSQQLRRKDLFNEERLFAHFEGAIPRDIVNVPAFNKWIATATHSEMSKFLLDKKAWLETETAAGDFPESIRIDGVKIRLSYLHEPDEPEKDGITATVFKRDAAVLRKWRADWLVPGMLPLKVNFLLDSLPSSLRRVLSPITDTTAIILPLLNGRDRPLTDAIREVLFKHNGITIPYDAFHRVALPPHLKVRYRVIDEGGREIAVSRDLETVLGAPGIAPPPRSASEIAAELPQRITPKEKKVIEQEINSILFAAQFAAEDVKEDVETQIAWMTFPNWERVVAAQHLTDYSRYLKGIRIRLDRARTNLVGDRTKAARFEPYWTQYAELAAKKFAGVTNMAAMTEYRWMLEEYRLSLFAQELGTKVKVSPERLSRKWMESFLMCPKQVAK